MFEISKIKLYFSNLMPSWQSFSLFIVFENHNPFFSAVDIDLHVLCIEGFYRKFGSEVILDRDSDPFLIWKRDSLLCEQAHYLAVCRSCSWLEWWLQCLWTHIIRITNPIRKRIVNRNDFRNVIRSFVNRPIESYKNINRYQLSRPNE